MKKPKSILSALVLLIVLAIAGTQSDIFDRGISNDSSTTGTTLTDTILDAFDALTAEDDSQENGDANVAEEGTAEREWSDPIINPYEIAAYLYEYGELPDNFITKEEARALGWDSSENYVSDVAPGMSIGGDYFGNYEGGLPDADGRDWYECDANYTSGKRGAERILYSDDGLVYYSPDHYETFELIPEE